jgi:hypothetical protein
MFPTSPKVDRQAEGEEEQPMRTKRWVLAVCLGFGLAALWLGVIGYRASREARVLVEWSTASELDTVGFNIYRSEDPQATGQRINLELVPASEDSQAGGDYTYIDKNVSSGHTYYYFLEDVNSGGIASRHGPVVVKAQAGGMVELWSAGILFCSAIAIAGLQLIPRHRGPKKTIVVGN